MPIYWAFLTYMLLRPGTENHEYWFMFSGIDKVIHVSIFALLAFCFRTALPKVGFIYFIQIMLVYAFATEILQDEMHLGRSAELLDIVADTAGFFLGSFCYMKVKNLNL
ncbi:VanZ family protein [Chryseobacterium sp.]|nr:VanZ family protein [Chryseobacterium sp.]